MNSVWYEKYSPRVIEDVILPENIKSALIGYIKNEKLPNLGFWSDTPGLGKSCTAKAIIRSMNADALFLNASLEKGIDVLRSKITQFASSCSLEDCPRVVVMDECLDENEEVIILEDDKKKFIKLKNLEKECVYDCLSLNLKTGEIEKDTCCVISDKFDNVYEVKLEDGRIIHVTSNHPFIVEQNDRFISKSIDDGLNTNDIVACLNDDVVVSIYIKSIKKSNPNRVINLNVHKNHTFITKNGIITHNCDHITPDAQAAFRGFLDMFSVNCSFIFTGNYKTKMIEPLLNRLQNIDFAEFDKREIVPSIRQRLMDILIKENYQVNENTDRNIAEIIKANYPSIRGMISSLQQVVQENNFNIQIVTTNYGSVIELLKSNDYLALIQEVNSLSNPDSMFEYMYKRIDMFKNVPQAICILSKYQYQSSFARDKHLNLCACLVELKNSGI